jgi:hypothetical protein
MNRLIPPSAVLLLAAVAALAAGCRLVGSGTLDYVPAAERPSPFIYQCPEPGAWYCYPAATNGSPVEMKVFRAEPGDAWPPPGMLGISLRAQQIPFLAPAMNVTDRDPLAALVLVRLPEVPREGWPTVQSCAELDSTEGVVRVWDDNRIGAVTVNPDRTLTAFLAVPDTPENWQASWVLATDALNPFARGMAAPGYAIRCGAVSVPPP